MVFDITLIWKKQEIDLQIPANLTLLEFKDLLVKVFGENGVFLPADFLLRLKDKSVFLGDYDVLNEFPIGNGDIFEILELEAL